MKHITLLGDSIFDNAAYVNGGADVITHLQEQLPSGERATLCAVDGDVTTDVHGQLRRVPADATHLVVSVGGNDALGRAGVLMEGARSVAEALLHIAEVARGFERDYVAMLHAVLQRGLPVAVCTIYDPRFDDAMQQSASVAGLVHFNNCILRTAFGIGVPVLDLRLICNDRADYANEIEPSVQGGGKIAQVINRLVAQHDFTSQRSSVFVS